MGLEFADAILRWIPDPVIGKQSARGFDILIVDDPLCLNKQCSANITVGISFLKEKRKKQQVLIDQHELVPIQAKVHDILSSKAFE